MSNDSMKLTKGRLIFVLLSLVVIVLLGVMVGLQLLIITSPTATTVGADRTDQTSLPAQVNSPTAIQLALATVAPSATPTFAPPPTLTPPAVATPTPVPPTLAQSTPEKALVAPAIASTLTVALATATEPATATVPAIAPATVPAPVTPVASSTATNTAAPPADIRLGETDRSVDCKFVTDIVQLFLERQMKLRITRVHFNSVNNLFLALAAHDANQKIDLTLCYIDPDDRAYLQQYDSTLLFVAGNYAERDHKRLFAVGNSTLIVQLKTQRPCVYNFLKNLDFGDLQFPAETDASQWLAQNSGRTLAWSQCQ